MPLFADNFTDNFNFAFFTVWGRYRNDRISISSRNPQNYSRYMICERSVNNQRRQSIKQNSIAMNESSANDRARNACGDEADMERTARSRDASESRDDGSLESSRLSASHVCIRTHVRTYVRLGENNQ